MDTLLRAICVVPFLLPIAATAHADTTEVKHETPVVVAKSGSHCGDDPNCFNRYHPAIKPVAHGEARRQSSSSRRATRSTATSTCNRPPRT